MKKIIYLALSCIIALASCKKYLDIIPDNIPTIEYAFDDRVRAERYLVTCYSYLPNLNTPSNPATYSDMVWSNDAVDFLNQYGHKMLRDGNNSSNPYLDYWEGANGGKDLWQGIRDCNIFIENIGKVRDLEDYEKKRWTAEVKFLKAYYHFYLLQMYGPIPVVRENIPVSAPSEQVKVFREPVDEVVDYIIQLLNEASPDLPLKIENEVSELGRITKPICLAMKAKILVTAASPLFNGNRDYPTMIDKRGKALFNQVEDKDKWVKALDACKAAIDTCHMAGIQLYKLPVIANLSDSTKTVLTVSQIVTDKWNKERIWGSGVFSSVTTEEYTIPRLTTEHAVFTRMAIAPTLKMAELYYSNNGVPINEDKFYDYDNRYSLTTSTDNHKFYLQKNVFTVKLHMNREARFYGGLGIDGGLWYGLGRVDDLQQWPVNTKLGSESGFQHIERFTPTGYFIKKLSNYLSTYNTTTYVSKRWDFPIFRLADLYLLHAEALNETLSAPTAEVYTYIDQIRQRAGLKSVAESWSSSSRFPEKYLNKEGMRDIIRREREIELAFEGHHFWDIRRWKLAIQRLNEPIRGWNIQGKTPDDFYQVRTIKNIQYSIRDVLWPIRRSNLSINNNLVQNPGW